MNKNIKQWLLAGVGVALLSGSLAASAADAHADFAPAGQKLEHLELDGGVHLAQTQLGQSRALEAGRVVLAFAGPQVLSSLTAYGSAGKPATLKESGAQAGSLSAPQLDFAFASQTAATSSLLTPCPPSCQCSVTSAPAERSSPASLSASAAGTIGSARPALMKTGFPARSGSGSGTSGMK